MGSETTRLSVELTPSARIDVIDVKKHIQEQYGDVLSQYRKTLYCSYHTTAGYFEQTLCERLDQSPDSLQVFLRPFQELFPEGAEYQHDRLDLRAELSDEERIKEPRNADSHLKYIGSGLENCVTYANHPEAPVFFVDLDGMNEDQPRRRRSTVIGFNDEEEVGRIEFEIPVSGHGIDSISLRDARLGIYEHLQELVLRHGVEKGWIEIELDPVERNTGLTVNEYETLLMKHDLLDVLRDPLRFMKEKGRNMLRDPRAIPGKAKNYAKYDLVRFVNEALDALGLSESVIERVIDRILALPASRFLRMKRRIRLLVCEEDTKDGGMIVQGRYQSPILVQWKKTDRGSRRLIATLNRCI
jgi:thiamine phosphate synthase YjbQ (UPF0047 family)